MTDVLSVPVRSDRQAFTQVDWLLFSAIGIIWGSSFLLIKIALGSLHPGLITWSRVGLGAAALLALPSSRVKIERADQAKVVLLSLLWVGIPFTLYPLAEQHINSAVTGLLTGATPFFTGLFAALWFGRRTRGSQRLAVAIGFGGVILIGLGSGAAGGTAPVGVVMVLVAAVCYGYATNLASPLQQRYGSVPLMGRMLALATVWTAPFGVVGAANSHLSIAPVMATAVLGVVGTGIAFAFMATLVGRVGGPRASFITYLIPLVALGLGAFVLDETVSRAGLVGVVLVLSAALLASRSER